MWTKESNDILFSIIARLDFSKSFLMALRDRFAAGPRESDRHGRVCACECAHTSKDVLRAYTTTVAFAGVAVTVARLSKLG